MSFIFVILFFLLLVFYCKNNKPKILISYVYHETTNTKENLAFLLRHGVYNNVYILINIKGPTSDEIPINKNVRVINTKNEGFDYGGHLQNFQHLGDAVYNFDYVVIMNDSACGPFITNWYQPFVEKLKKCEYVGVIKNQGWFNMVKIETLPKIIRILKQAKLFRFLQ